MKTYVSSMDTAYVRENPYALKQPFLGIVPPLLVPESFGDGFFPPVGFNKNYPNNQLGTALQPWVHISAAKTPEGQDLFDGGNLGNFIKTFP